MEKVTSPLAAQVALNRTFNRINDVLDEEGVSLVAGNGTPVLVMGRGYAANGHELKWYEGCRTHAYAQNRPPIDWDDFLARQCDIDKQKGHDYNFSYMLALVKWGPTIWKWEATKKINRIRTWVAKGELQVKGEGLVNAVGDLFNYAVMYANYAEARQRRKNPVDADTPADFYRQASAYSAQDWLEMIIDEGLIGPDEDQVKHVVITFLAGEGAAYR